jgi:hypothetical protein
MIRPSVGDGADFYRGFVARLQAQFIAGLLDNQATLPMAPMVMRKTALSGSPYLLRLPGS